MIIGESGFARSGKDEAASVLVQKHGFIRVAFADKLRDFLFALNPVVAFERGFSVEGVRDSEGALWTPIRLRDVIDVHGWNGYKETKYGVEIRGLLQRLGTEAGRGVLGENIWIDAALSNLDENKNYVVTDARFINEFDAIRRAAERQDHVCAIVRIDRPGVGPANDHASEMEALTYDQWDAKIVNDGSIEDLHRKIIEVADWRNG